MTCLSQQIFLNGGELLSPVFSQHVSAVHQRSRLGVLTPSIRKAPPVTSAKAQVDTVQLPHRTSWMEQVKLGQQKWALGWRRRWLWRTLVVFLSQKWDSIQPSNGLAVRLKCPPCGSGLLKWKKVGRFVTYGAKLKGIWADWRGSGEQRVGESLLEAPGSVLPEQLLSSAMFARTAPHQH